MPIIERKILTTLALDGEKEYTQSMNSAYKELRVLSTELKASDAEFANNGKSIEAMTKKDELLRKEIAQQQEIVRSLTGAVEEAALAYGEDSKVTDEYRIKLNNAKAALANNENALKANSKALADAKNKTKLFADQLTVMSKKLTASGEKLSSAGRKMSQYLTTAIVAAGAAAVKLASDYEDSINKINTLDLSASQDKINGIKSDIIALSSETGTASTDIAQATYQMGSALGSLGSDVVDYVQVATKAAIGGFTDAETAVNGLSTVFNTYGYTTAAEMEKISDQMLTAQNLGKTTFGEMAESIGNVVPIFKQAGGSTEELFSAIAILTKNGIGTDEAITALKGSISNIISPSEEATAAAEVLGLKFSASEIKAKGFSGMLREINESLKQSAPEYAALVEQYAQQGKQLEELTAKKNASKKVDIELNAEIAALKKQMSETSSAMDVMANAADSPIAAYATLFGNIRALNGMLVLASDEGLDQYEGALNSMADAAGATNAAYTKMQEGVSAKAKKLLTSVKNVGIQFGDLLITKLTPVIDWAKSFIDKLSAMDEAQQQQIITIAAIAAAAGPLLVIMGKISTGIGAIMKGISLLITSPVGMTMAALAVVIGGLYMAMDALGTSTKRLNTAVENGNDKIDAYRKSIDSLTPTITDVNDLLSGTGKTVAQLDASIQESEDAITAILSTALQEQRDLRAGEIEDIKNYNAQILALNEEKLAMYRGQQIAEMQKIMLEEGEMTKEQAAQRMVDAKAAYENSNAVAEESYTAQLSQLYNYYSARGQLDSQAYLDAQQAAKANYDQQISDNGTYYQQSLTALSAASQQWIAADYSMWDTLIADARAYQTAKAGVDNQNIASWQQYSASAKATGAQLQSDFAAMWGSIDVSAANGALQYVLTAKQMGADVDAQTQAMVSGMLSLFEGLPPDMQDAGKNALLGMISGLESEIPSLGDTSDDTADEIVQTIKDTLGIQSPSTVMKGIGKNVVQGLEDGMNSKQESVSNVASSIGEKLVNTFKNIFGIKSPSKVMRDQIGLPMMQGVAEGIRKNAGLVDKAFGGITPDAISTSLVLDATRNFNDVARSAAAPVQKSGSGTTVTNTKAVQQTNNYNYTVHAQDTSYAKQQEISRKAARTMTRELSADV